MGEVRSGASTARLRPPPPFAAPPARVHQYTSLLRLHGYLRPYLSRWVTMLVVALLGTGATIVVPLVTKAVIDGPIADRDERGLFTLGRVRPGARRGRGGADVRPPLGRRARHARRRDRDPDGPLRAPAAAADGLPRPVAVRPAAVPGDDRPVDHPPVPRLRPAVPRRQHPADRRGHRDPAAACTGRSAWWCSAPRCRSCCWCLRNERQFTRLSRRGPGPDRATWPPSVEEGAHGLRVIKAFGRADHVFARFDERALRLHGDLDGEGPASRRGSGPSSRSSRTSP